MDKKIKKANMDKKISFAFLLFFTVIFLIPIVWIFLSAFKDESELLQAGGFLYLPNTWTFENFIEILDPGNDKAPIYLWFGNSVLVSVSYVLLSVSIVSMAAYAFTKLRFFGRDFLFLTILFVTSFPAIINIVPLYKTMHILNWLNSPLALIFPGLAGAFNIFLTKQFLHGIPDSLIEAGRIDGANEFRIYFRLVLPLLKPILIIVAIFSFSAIWNDFMWPSIAINDIEKLTLTSGLQLAQGTYEHKPALMSAVAVAALVPMIVFYLFAEKWLINGVSISSGVKG